MYRARVSRNAAIIILSFAAFIARSEVAQAEGAIPLSLDAGSLVSDAVPKAITRLIAFSQQHRPYEPATPLGTQIGLDFSVEATLVKVPDSFYTDMSDAGFPLGSSVPFLPAAKLHLHKGFSEFFDLGGSALYYPGYKILGADAKIVLVQGEEGPTWAFRFCYTYVDLAISGINVSTKTFAPQLLVSRQMEFADPYVGIALEYALGALDATLPPVDIPGAPAGTPQVTLPPVSKSASAIGAMAFGGLSLRIPRSGIRLTLEGAYDYAGTVSMGTKIGFTF